MHGHAPYLLGLEGLLPENRVDRVERPLDWRADGPFFYVAFRNLEAFAESVDESLGLCLRRVCLEVVVRA